MRLMVRYILEIVKKVLLNELEKAIKKNFSVLPRNIEISYPKDRNLGDIATSVAFQLAYLEIKNKKKAREAVNKYAAQITSELQLSKIPYISELRVVNGYINGYLQYDRFTRDVIKNILELGESYGAREKKGKKVVIEHTSANPIHPLHVGTARNSILGDSIARIYRFIGYDIERRFYVNDVGKQVAYLVYAYSKIKDKVNISGKPDHWFGSLYSLANAIIEVTKGLITIESLKRDLIQQILKKRVKYEASKNELEALLIKLYKIERYSAIDWIKTLNSIINAIKEEKAIESIDKEIKENITKLHEALEITVKWLRILSDLTLRWPTLSKLVLRELINENDIERKISELMRKYESGQDRDVNNLFHDVCRNVLEGIKETLSKVDIEFDRFDWESELVRSGIVSRIINELSRRGWVIEDENGAKILNIKEACKLEDIRRIFDMKEFKPDTLPPNLVLIRSDGTTLYTTRDIAYAVLKGSDETVEKVFNVIGKDQELPQKQLKAALYLAGYKNIAKKITHVSYELVILPGEKLSARRGRYVTFDEIIDEAIERALEEIRKRRRDLSQKEQEDIAKAVGVGAVKYALISVAPEKIITFDWARVINFEQNSGPFLQYSYARATSILRKINYDLPDPDQVRYEVLKNDVEKDLIFNLARFPEIILESSRKIRPDIIADYANKISILFNSFYQRYPVLKAETEDIRKARLLLVEAFRVILRNAMNLLGIKPIEKM